ncbi:hypothetical protein PIB30_014173 [Stylosanthes scabra]|uniref:Uncharacterized protein n=1 Tax=Stylosanthes scabra TaxID=79078 RepID=A0ABU6V9V4_9FABA|nr:hypothetical protein [Stylosanthes scabra]
MAEKPTEKGARRPKPPYPPKAMAKMWKFRRPSIRRPDETTRHAISSVKWHHDQNRITNGPRISDARTYYTPTRGKINSPQPEYSDFVSSRKLFWILGQQGPNPLRKYLA